MTSGDDPTPLETGEDRAIGPVEAAASGLKEAEVKRRHILPKALVVGLVAGLIASGFRMALHFLEHGRIAWIQRLPLVEGFVIAVGIGALGSGIGLWLVRRFSPEAAGSGIPDLKSVVMGEKELHWKRVLPVKFLSGVVGIGAGLTLISVLAIVA